MYAHLSASCSVGAPLNECDDSPSRDAAAAVAQLSLGGILCMLRMNRQPLDNITCQDM